MKVSAINYLRRTDVRPYNSVLRRCEVRGEVCVVGYRSRKFTELKFDMFTVKVQLPETVQSELKNACKDYWQSKPENDRRNDGWLWGVGHAGLFRMQVLNEDVPYFVEQVTSILDAYEPT